VVRPPLAVVHGIWDDDRLWETFSPLVWGTNANDPRFSIFRVNFGDNVSALVEATHPPYANVVRRKILRSALGFEHNAGIVQKSIRRELEVFKTGKNPAGISVAAVQVDVVAHSMGGAVTRTMPLLPDFRLGHTYGQGVVHKLVTVDTPHKGSVLATLLTAQMQKREYCVANFLGYRGGNVVLRDARLRGLGLISGAVADLVHKVPSEALQRMNRPGGHRIPTATVVGVFTNWASLTHSLGTGALHQDCPDDTLARHMTEELWKTLFTADDGTLIDSDGVVGVDSQDPNGTGRHFSSYVHSIGMVNLGFAEPKIISNGEVPTRVIFLLNTPLSNTNHYRMMP
jgi:pimeloyl-ACP methyl ester carboxylesterase